MFARTSSKGGHRPVSNQSIVAARADIAENPGVSEIKRAGTAAATALVVASMVGTGVFTSLGFQLVDLNSAPQILFLWALGGVIALCGALCYAEVAAALPRSGGEYHFLGTLYHPSLGFMAGMLSATAGFAAPTAITALAFGEYLHETIPALPVKAAAVAVVLAGSAAHAVGTRTSARVQVAATLLKLALIAVFIVAAWLLPGKGDIRWTPDPAADLKTILQPAFAVALLFVFYAYTGWNAAVYGLEEWHRPERTVRRALVGGTLIVSVLYLGLNASFLHAAPVAELRGVVQVGHVASVSLFGDATARAVSGFFALGLFASVSALLWAGPRVLGAMGRDLPALRWFAPRREVPHAALIFQAGLALLLIFAGTFRELITLTQIGLTLSTSLVVGGCLVLRHRRPELPRPVHVPLYPLPPLIFLAMSGFVILRSAVAEPGPTLTGLAIATGFFALWFPLQRHLR
jgi:APA family basic amino acid/polyamine antiporter